VACLSHGKHLADGWALQDKNTRKRERDTESILRASRKSNPVNQAFDLTSDSALTPARKSRCRSGGVPGDWLYDSDFRCGE
jgi:hypothetical protein